MEEWLVAAMLRVVDSVPFVLFVELLEAFSLSDGSSHLNVQGLQVLNQVVDAAHHHGAS